MSDHVLHDQDRVPQTPATRSLDDHAGDFEDRTYRVGTAARQPRDCEGGSVEMMDRRGALTVLSGGVLALADAGSRLLAAPASDVRRLTRLSRKGSGRATAYAEANKIVTVGDRTHVTWLDSIAAGFRVRVRTLDRKNHRWSETWTVGEAHDNHGGSSLTADSRGYLHLAYFPHHHAFRYRRSLRPNDASAWSDEVRFGAKLTYPTLVCGPDDTLYLTARRSWDDRPWTVEMWRQPVGKPWEPIGTILRSRANGYSHFQEALAWSPDHRVLHLSCRIHERRGAIEVVGYMRSEDFGRTWRRRDGSVIPQPATGETIDVIAVGSRSPGKLSHKCGTIAVDREGTPIVVYSAANASTSEMIVASPEGRSGWKRQGLAAAVAGHAPGWRIGPAAEVVVNQEGTMYISATMARQGHNDIALIKSRDLGRTISIERPAAGVDRTRKWLPNLERPTGQHAVRGRPGLIFTAGVRGEGNKDILENDVYWA